MFPRRILPLAKALLLATALASSEDDVSHKKKPPSIVLFMTDDQDVQFQSLDYMPRLNRLFRQEGTEFEHYYVPTGLCCPSRATILRGQYCHNTEIYDNADLNNATYKSGGWGKFVETGLELETFATRLQQAGYETALVGKYMNGYTDATHVPPGFDHWMGMTTMAYYGPKFSDNGKPLQLNKTVYQTDFIRDWALDFIKHKRDKSKPFFLMITPFAPHSPATPAKRHQHLFNNKKVPRHPSFNPPDSVQKHRPSWIQALPPLTPKQIDDLDEFYRNRLRALQAVDEALELLATALEDDSTYFFFTSDNGQHFGDFRIPAGKRQAYDTDVRVPLLVRGPKIERGGKIRQVVQSVDLGPTFLDLASSGNGSSGQVLSTSYPMDGKSILPLLHNSNNDISGYNDFRWTALVEMYGGSSNIGLRYKNIMKHYYYHNHMFPNTYQGVRIVNGPGPFQDADLLYVEWCTGEQELYNSTSDPHQVENLVHKVDGQWLHRLSRLLAKLGDCKGKDCYQLDEFAAVQQQQQVEVSTDQRLLRLQESIKGRLPCFNPSNWNHVDTGLRRRPFAVGWPVPEPFEHGFPFSDGDLVSDELLEVWEQYQHYFY